MMTPLTRQAKEMLVLDLYYNQDKTYRQIAKEARICPRDIKAILDKKVNKTELNQSMSVSSQAFSLFLENKTPLDVAIMLNLKEPEVHEFYKQYLSLQQLSDLYRIYEKIKDGIGSFVELYRLIEAAGMNISHVKRLLEVANGELPKVEETYKNLLSDVMSLNQKKREGETSILKLNGDIIYLRNTVDHQRLECEKQESEKRKIYLKKIRLESAIKELQNSQEYTKIETIVIQLVKKMFGDNKQLLKFAFEAIIKSLLKNPYRLQSFMEYALSSTFASTISCGINDNMEYDTKLGMYDQRYLSPDYKADRMQIEYLKNIMLDASERFYNKKVENLMNMAISEAEYDNNQQLSQTSNEKESIEGLLLLGITKSEQEQMCAY